MYKIRLMNEFLHGPIWVLNSDGISVWKYPLIEQDAVLSELNQSAKELFDSYQQLEGVFFELKHMNQNKSEILLT